MGEPILVTLHAGAPEKPPMGAPCNGCGVCCAAETCPVARVLFWQRQGPCPALCWQLVENRYRCGLIVAPERYWQALRWAPAGARQRLGFWFARCISAGRGCDSDAAVVTGPVEP